MSSGLTDAVFLLSMRRAQYRIPGPGGPAECVVFYFGPGQGGDTQANVARWASQFHRADGGPVGDAFKTREIKVGDIRVVLVEVAGTYVGGMGSGPTGPERPNYMREHKGTIDVESLPGKGTIFVLTFPGAGREGRA